MNASLKLNRNLTPAAVRCTPAPTARAVAHRRWFSPTSNPQLFTTLYSAHRARVTQLLVRNGVSTADADDVCADVFMIAMRKLSTFEGASTASTWLCGIARKVAADHRRSARVRYEVACDVLPEGATVEGPHEHAEAAERCTSVREAVATLKSGPREVVRGFLLDERPMDEVAKRARVPLQTAYARLYAGQKALSKHFMAQATHA